MKKAKLHVWGIEFTCPKCGGFLSCIDYGDEQFSIYSDIPDLLECERCSLVCKIPKGQVDKLKARGTGPLDGRTHEPSAQDASGNVISAVEDPAPILLKAVELALLEFKRISYQKKADPEVLKCLEHAVTKARGSK